MLQYNKDVFLSSKTACITRENGRYSIMIAISETTSRKKRIVCVPVSSRFKD